MQHYYKSFTEAYKGLLQDVYENPDYICAPRGQKIKEKLAVKFTIENPRDRLLFIKDRNFNLGYVLAENLWYLSGNDLTSWIAYYSKFWEKITDDGVHATSAYGSRIFKPHKWCAQGKFIDYDEECGDPFLNFDNLDKWTQWNWIIDELCKDNDSRRAVIHIRTPYDSRYSQKDVPCTLSLQFFVRDNKLFQIVSMRSSDSVLGIANDVPAFTMFQELLAFELSKCLNRPIELGSYTHISNSLHIYDRNFEMVEKIIANPVDVSIPMPSMTSSPPIEHLMNLEDKIRNSNEPGLILRDIIGMESYWRDWLIVLASHRYGKLGNIEQKLKTLVQTNWEGFHWFKQ